MPSNKLAVTTFTALYLTSVYSFAADLDIAEIPLYLGGAVEPNVMFTLDDSGSMHYEVMPNEARFGLTRYMFPVPSDIYGTSRYTENVPLFNDDNVYNYYLRSSENNKVFYNPDVEYTPWSNANGTSMANANPSAALYNPAAPSVGSMNLRSQQTQYSCWIMDDDSDLGDTDGDYCRSWHTFWPITYFNYKGSGGKNLQSSYNKVQITSATPSGATFTSPGGVTRTRDEEIQNFANWFQYYRSRVLVARAGVGKAFGSQGKNLRVGFAAINQGNKTVDGVSTGGTIIEGVRAFDGNDRDTFFERLYEHPIPRSGTPLRTAAKDVGKYFERSDNRGPWGNTPGTNDNTAHLTCRQSYHILTTDGYWNGSGPGVGNADGTAGQTISGPDDPDYQYQPAPPYQDNWSNTLADATMDFWKRDLRPNLANEVPTNPRDPAFWQHLVTFTVGLGVNGTLNPDTDYAGLASGNISWPKPDDDEEENIDDLWHAAINSRGDFFSAADPDDFASALGNILSSISERTASSSSVALNSGTVSGDTRVYQARFESGSWTGQLRSIPLTDDGFGTLDWEASSLIPGWNNRKILTWSNNDGQRFRWDRITAAQRSLLNNNQSLLQYIRGNQSLERDQQNGVFRIRPSVLGDIINSSPQFVGPPSQRYRDYWGENAAENASPYSAFKAAQQNRDPVVYVGANDGMLHAFDADDGNEIFAYIPDAVYPRLAGLSDPDFTHRYLVDGTPTVVDAFVNGAWKSILVSGLGAGGQAIFAIDVTNPSDFSSEASGAEKVLWEFNDSDDSDLGYTFSKPSIIRLRNGDWAALFTSGYNNTEDNANDGSTGDSQTGKAFIYLLDIATGNIIKKFDTEAGSSADPTGNARPNGIASPAAVDVDNDYIIDYVYAGDLFGNMWKIDLTGDTVASWDFSSRLNSKPEPIFRACAGTCTSTTRQPITSPPNVVRHPTGAGSLVLFGTGKYLEVNDNTRTNQVTQSYYAIWDKPEPDENQTPPPEETLINPPAVSRSSLLSQSIEYQGAVNGNEFRVTSDEKINWSTNNGWYMDFVYNGSNNGERQVSASVITGGRLIFTTLLPSNNPCDFGGDSWVMQLDINSGSRLNFSTFDLNNDGAINEGEDLLSLDGSSGYDADGNCKDNCVRTSGRKSKVGISGSPSVIRTADGQDRIIISGSDTGNAGNNLESIVTQGDTQLLGRQSWQRLEFSQ